LKEDIVWNCYSRINGHSLEGEVRGKRVRDNKRSLPQKIYTTTRTVSWVRHSGKVNQTKVK
jgi:hypothetical protein